jgi:hypothetical protein
MTVTMTSKNIDFSSWDILYSVEREDYIWIIIWKEAVVI